jgi:hypothetical protein
VSDEASLTREHLLAARYFYRSLAAVRLKRIEELEAEVERLRSLLEQSERVESA